MAKDMNELHKRGEKLGLSDDELAFYDAISSNESARDFYENDVLKQIAKELTISIKNNIKDTDTGFIHTKDFSLVFVCGQVPYDFNMSRVV